MNRLALILILLLPGLALAQSVTLTTATGANTVSFGQGSCGASVTLTWAANPAPNSGWCTPGIQVWAQTIASGATVTCPAGPPDGGVIYTVAPTTLQSSSSGNFTLTLSQLPGLDAASCNVDGGVDVTDVICPSANFTSNPLFAACGSASVPWATASGVTLLYNGQPPGTPTFGGILELDQQLVVPVNANSASPLASSVVSYVPAAQLDGGSPTWRTASSPASNPSQVTISGLTNETRYALKAYVVDTAGNQSPESAVVDATPHATVGFFSRYVMDGGKTGGCAAAGPFLPFLGLGEWLRRRARRKQR